MRYRIAAVAERTGVHETTLRAWERRYGVPTPKRGASGYRLYSEADIEDVREMRRLCDLGMAAAEAAPLVLQRERPSAASSAQNLAIDQFELAVHGLLGSVGRFDDAAFDRQLARAMLLGTAQELLDQVFIPVLTSIGARWECGTFSVAQEHFATYKIGTAMGDLLRLLPGSDAGDSVVLACFADEDHELGLLGLALRVSEWGLRPLYLGARTPPSAIGAVVRAVSPKIVALSVTITPPRRCARTRIQEYGAACGEVPWIVGGPGAASLGDLVEAHGGVVFSGNSSEQHSAVRAHMLRLTAPADPTKSAR